MNRKLIFSHITYLLTARVFNILIFYFSYNLAWSRDASTLKLQRESKLGISFDSCKSIENKIGQLFYINVDGFGKNTPSTNAISPAYISLVKDLQIGGVLPHTDSYNPDSIRRDFKKLQLATEQPLLIGVDYLALSGLEKNLALKGKTQNAAQADEGGASFGLGYGAGFLGTYGGNSKECLKRIAYLDAFLHKAVGLNQALGPTIERDKEAPVLNQEANRVAPIVNDVIEQFNEMGVATTAKHFPYTPDTYNLHKKSKDTSLPREEVLKRLEVFKLLSNKTGFVMSTHLMNSNIDPKDVATFSETWISLLRKHVGSDSILMTDGLFMFDDYDQGTKSVALKWPHDQIKVRNNHTIFAARSILAGHDMVLLEGTASETRQVFDELLAVACQDKPLSRKLRERIDESYTRITNWKSRNQGQLTEGVDIPKSLLDEAQKLYPTAKNDCPNDKKFNEFKRQVDELKLKPMGKANTKESEQPTHTVR